ncbi:MAG: hypothetical protein MRJ67_13315 [Nitrospirales bacterium]|nr:hypothetical protein [Nitrospirales bacterium]
MMTGHNSQNPGPHRATEQIPKDIRCKCGKLVARWEHYGIEIKCARCQRLVSIPFKDIKGRKPDAMPDGAW